MKLVAVDGGGTGCRALIADAEGCVLGRGEGGPANIMTDPEGALKNLQEALDRACRAAGLLPEVLPECSAVMGLAGANVGGHGETLRRRLPFAECIILSDATIAVRGALGSHDGVVGILGTGSVFGAQSGGEIRLLGGWGFLLGDQGSGARLGRALLEAALLAHDRVVPGSELTEAALARFGGDARAVVSFGHAARPADFAAFAPDVFTSAQRRDQVAVRLVQEAASVIEASLHAVMPKDCERLCLMGGLAASYTPYLGERFRSMLKPPLGTALDGALGLALQKFSQSTRL